MIKLNDDVIAKTNEFIVEFCYNKDKSYVDYSLEIGDLGIIKIHNNIDLVVKEISEDEAIKLLIDQGKVKVVGAYYDLDGKVTFY